MARLEEHDGVLGDLAGSARLLTDGEVARLIGRGRYAALSARQRADLAVRLSVVRWWRRYKRSGLVERGRWTVAAEGFARAASRRFRRSVSSETLMRWVRQYAASGAGRLVDQRGRRFQQILDPGALTIFGELLDRGEGFSGAHACVLARAERVGLVWPRTLRTLRRLLDAPGEPRRLRLHRAEGRTG